MPEEKSKTRKTHSYEATDPETSGRPGKWWGSICGWILRQRSQKIKKVRDIKCKREGEKLGLY